LALISSSVLSGIVCVSRQAGQERYRAITTAYYRGALGAMLIFDVTKSASFENIPRWLRELKDHANRDIVLSMIGNKIDLTESAHGGNALARQVSEESERAMAAELQLPVIETSAKTGVGVDSAFVALIERIYAQTQLNKPQAAGAVPGAATAAPSASVQLSQQTEHASQESKCC
jgi:GTPase SAR1 family protein